MVSFGGPEGPDDVMPFLENVVRGKDVPRERLLAVARQYESFGGCSPANDQSRALLAALIGELNAHGPQLPVYWGNRNWHPLLADAVGQMAEDEVHHGLAFVTSAFGSYPTCRQYLEDIEQARAAVGPDAPTIDKLRLFYNHPGFIEATAERVVEALEEIPPERRDRSRLIFTAHSIPAAMAERSPYERQLREACRLATESMKQKGEGGRERSKDWQLVFQSRSGRPEQPWLGPDIREHVRRLQAAGPVADLVVAPIGFLTEHKETIYDLDVEVGQLCEELGINMVRAATVGNHPRLVRMIRELVVERIDPSGPRLALGCDGPWPDQCLGDCCLIT